MLANSRYFAKPISFCPERVILLPCIGGGALRPKIALVTSGFGTTYGGIGVVAQMIVSALEKDTDLSIWEHPAFWPRMLRIPVTVWRTLRGSLDRPDLVVYDHVHLAVLHATIPGLKRVPYAVFLHGIEVWQPLPLRRREALLRANLLLANSAVTEANARNFNPWLPKIEVTWLGVPDQPHPADVRSLPPISVMVGRMASSECKGHDAVMDAWPLIRAAVPDAKLMIVGTGNDEHRLRRRVMRENLAGMVFCGQVSDEQRDQMYRSCRLLLYPSKQEGYGLAAVEAASFGVPVLAVAGTVMEELFPNGLGTVLVNNVEKNCIADAAIRLLADGQYAWLVGMAGRARVQSIFLEEHFAQRFREKLKPIIRGHEVVAESGTGVANRPHESSSRNEEASCS